MHKFILVGLGSVLALGMLPETAHAHGGQYRGPPDIVPPNPGGRGGNPVGGPKSPNPGNPTTPGGGPPAAPAPTPPGTGTGPAPTGAPPNPTTGPRGIEIVADLTLWEHWWEFNKDAYIGLKDAIYSNRPVSGSAEYHLGWSRKVETHDSLAPTEGDRRNLILPALKKAIDSTEDRDIQSSCMVAMAKVGMDHPDFMLHDVFLPRLKRPDQEVRETAALALGIAALNSESNVELLVELATDSAVGRQACNQPEVNERTRAFAAYGLGLIAHANADVALKRSVFTPLRAIVDSEEYTLRNLKVAAINAIALLNVRPSDDAGRALRDDALDCLQRFYLKDLEVGRQLLQAHVPPAVAKLLGAYHADARVAAHWKALFAADLGGKGERQRNNNLVAASCALALGQLCAPCDDDAAADIEYCKLLRRTWKLHKDQQTKYFSILALGQIGGAWNRSVLISEFDTANKSIEKPWVALAMGVQAFEKQETDRAQSRRSEPDDGFGRTLREALDEVKDPDSVAAFAVALGLCHYEPAADDLRARLQRSKAQEKLAGYLCIGLALLGDSNAKDDIHEIVRTSVRRPELLRQAAIALGRLGDKNVTCDLQQRLRDEDASLAEFSAIASALGFIGDRGSIEPLARMLGNQSLTDLSRAFAAVALGGVGDKEMLPWNSKIGVHINYRAAVETLVGSGAGILEIL